MHWQANLLHGPIVTSDTAQFGDLDAHEVVLFSIVERHAGFGITIWETATLPLVYATRRTPNEVIHVIATPTEKVFVFEGTGEVIRQTKWGDGVFAPIASD